MLDLLSPERGDSDLPHLFDTLTINKMELSNRFVRSATFDGLADQGMATDSQVNLYRELAKGDIGLIISSPFLTTKDDRFTGQLAADTDDAIPSVRRLVSVVHENGGKIAAQLVHMGWQSSPKMSGFQPVGPSATVNPWTKIQVRELSGDEIHERVEHFVQAARRVIEAGFDAVQLHGAHSYLISAFLSPVTNKRQDEWGGTPEKRSNFIRRICRGIRQLAGPDYPILIKLGLQDSHPEGMPLSEGIETARALVEDGIDAIEVSEGLEHESGHHIRLDAMSPYYAQECRQARSMLSVPLILVGGMRRLQDMQAVIENGVADAISMCRPFIMDPYLVKHLREGSTDYSECTSCNACIDQMSPGDFGCILT